MKVLLGLGNPGPRYAGTRHNAGAMVVQELAEQWNIPLNDRRDAFVGGAGQVAGCPVYLAISQVFMNVSGEAARGLSNKLGRQWANLVVLHDELDIALGRVRFKDDGGDGGHRGVRSIAQTTGTRGFDRVRIGVGRPPDGVAAAEHVLRRFTPDEKEALARGITRAAEGVELLLTDGLLAAQTKIHALN